MEGNLSFLRGLVFESFSECCHMRVRYERDFWVENTVISTEGSCAAVRICLWVCRIMWRVVGWAPVCTMKGCMGINAAGHVGICDRRMKVNTLSDGRS